LIIQSTILAVALFLVFPRLSPFWQMPIAKSAQIGLSDKVKPGDIAKLTRSTKLAFRVDFKEQKVPSYDQLYWRAMVLEDYDGKQWTRHDVHLSNQNLQAERENRILVAANQIKTSALSYQVIIEPSYQKFMFALAPAIVSNDQRDITAMPDYTFLSTSLISQAKSYQLTSYLNAPLALEISSHSNNINLRYPKGSNPRLEQLASKLKQDFIDPQALAKAVLARIFKEDFSYTLEPPLLKNNSLDQFFFDTQAGFCVHYASSFTFLMRASGVPARVVTGYLGGEYNDVNSSEQNDTKGHMSVYQYDAHAWSEIWVQGKGWLRIDPTGAVDPQRVNSGWSNQLLQQQSKLTNDFLTLYQLKNNAWLNKLRLRFDALDYQWSRWVIGFTGKQQFDLLQKWFGNMKPWKLAIIIGAVLIISMSLLMLILQFLHRDNRKRLPQKKWQAIYLSALSKLAKLGLTKSKEMTVNDFAKAVRQKTPELAISFTRLSNTYNTLSYQALNDDEQQRLTAAMTQQYRLFITALNNNK
jgi:transglutaminase-like putative cysteine protease